MKKHNISIFQKFLIITGIIILLWNIYWFVKVRVLHEYAFIIDVMLLTIGYIALVIYGIVSLIYLIKKRSNKK